LARFLKGCFIEMSLRLLVVLSLLAVLFSFSCSDDEPPREPTKVAAIGPEGGALSLGGATLTVPAGALDSAVQIAITQTTLLPPSGYRGASPVYRFSPEGLVFKKPATVEIQIEGPADGVGLLWTAEPDHFVQLTSTVENAKVKGSVLHFSLGLAGAPLPGQGTEDAGPDGALPPNPNPDPGQVPICSSDNWCWVNPLPQGARLRDVWAPKTGDRAWAVGDGGAILHFNGTRWTGINNSPAKGQLSGIGGTSADNIWIAGASDIVHWDGFVWTRSDPPPKTRPTAVWASAPNDVWMVGLTDILHFDGVAWSVFPHPPLPGSANEVGLSGIWGSAANDVWAMGGASMLHWNGVEWTLLPESGISSIWQVSGTAKNDVWAAGYGALAHFDGSTWTKLTLPAGATAFYDIWAGAPNDVWAAAYDTTYHFDGSQWQPVPSPRKVSIAAIAGRSGALWGVGDTIVKSTGGDWQETSTAITRASLNDIWGSAANDIWAVGAAGTLLHWTGTSWSLLTPAPTAASLESVWGTAANDIWAVGDTGTILHCDGSSWKTMTSSTTQGLRAVWASSKTSAWAVGYVGTVLRYNAGTWSSVSTPAAAGVMDIWGSGPSDVWAVGYQAVIHWNGQQWTKITVPDSAYSLDSVWGSGPNDVWATGTALIHWNGSQWSEVPRPGKYAPTFIWGLGANDVWSFYTDVNHWDGNAWAPSATPGQNYNALWGASPQDLWLVGSNGAIVHRLR
jgi:hypothetical protein